jgi:hypothetical protein
VVPRSRIGLRTLGSTLLPLGIDRQNVGNDNKVAILPNIKGPSCFFK